MQKKKKKLQDEVKSYAGEGTDRGVKMFESRKKNTDSQRGWIGAFTELRITLLPTS